MTDLEAAKLDIAPILESQGYDYSWRLTFGDDTPPHYAWFIKRDLAGTRTHHIHMIEANLTFHEHWERLRFRDDLIAHPDVARSYAELKTRLAAAHPNDRVAYTVGKSDSPHGGHPALRSATSGGLRSVLAVSSFRFRARLDLSIPSTFSGQRDYEHRFWI